MKNSRYIIGKTPRGGVLTQSFGRDVLHPDMFFNGGSGNGVRDLKYKVPGTEIILS